MDDTKGKDGFIWFLFISLLLLLILFSLYLLRKHIKTIYNPSIIQELLQPLLRNVSLHESGVVWHIKRCEQDNPEVRDVENQIMYRETKLIQNESWTQDLDDGQTPVLVFCVNVSRIGTDIESALKGVQNHRPVLVVLHCINKSSLRGDLSDDDYLLDQALRDRLTGIAHFAFSDFEGFYPCRQNEDGFRMLSDHITKV